MAAYAVPRLENREAHSGLTEQVERIRPALAPFRGRFLPHGGQPQTLGTWRGGVVLLSFPDLAPAPPAW